MIAKNLVIAVLFLTVTLAGLAELTAAPSNGTRFPPARKVELGYEYNAMFERPLDRSYGELKTQDHFYTVSFGVSDWFSLDGKIGIGDVTASANDHLPRLEYNTGFAGGYGFRIKAFDYKRWGIRLITGFQHISVHPQDRSADDDKYECFLDDWQVSGIVAKDWRSVTAYVGMKGSDCEIVYKLNKHDKKRRYSKEHLGLITGLELYFFDNKARVNLEGRFFDETALSAAVSYLF
ncbi:MAG: hypothetical protein PHP46_00955 [Candidatus Omnitrophica bacterium]|nr:hypothetical protein [Candidatus Omnitrophota bacterium]